MHFAELSMKKRQIGLTLAGATIALAIVLYRTDTSYSIEVPWTGFLLPVGTILCESAAFILFAARMIDIGVYHQMLRGAVKFNELYERELDSRIGWKSGLTEAISAYSRYQQPDLLSVRNEEGEKWKDIEQGTLAENKISRFYKYTIWALIISGTALLLAENIGAVQIP